MMFGCQPEINVVTPLISQPHFNVEITTVSQHIGHDIMVPLIFAIRHLYAFIQYLTIFAP